MPEWLAAEDPMLAQFEPLLQAIARVALGDPQGERAAVEQALEQMERGGWMLRAPVASIWQGERDVAALTQGLDAQDAALIARVLELIAAAER